MEPLLSFITKVGARGQLVVRPCQEQRQPFVSHNPIFQWALCGPAIGRFLTPLSHLSAGHRSTGGGTAGWRRCQAPQGAGGILGVGAARSVFSHLAWLRLSLGCTATLGLSVELTKPAVILFDRGL